MKFQKVEIDTGVGIVGVPTSYKNKIINGNFDFWQRGTSSTGLSSGTTFLSDRWATYLYGTLPTVDASQQSFTVGQTDVPDNPKYFHRTDITATGGASNSQVAIYQKIEDVRTFAGQTVTLSFYAKADSSKDICIEIQQSFGTGGSSTVYAITPQTVSLTSSWAKYEVTVDVASISGKTIGTANDSLFILFWLSAGSDLDARTNSLGLQTITFDIARVQIEKGYVATEFEQRPLGVELALCQRYYEQTYAFETAAGTVTNYGVILVRGGASVYLPGPRFQTPKRVAPTITIYSSSTGSSGYIFSVNASGDVAVSAVDFITEHGSRTITLGSSVIAYDRCYYHFTADAEL